MCRFGKYEITKYDITRRTLCVYKKKQVRWGGRAYLPHSPPYKYRQSGEYNTVGYIPFGFWGCLTPPAPFHHDS